MRRLSGRFDKYYKMSNMGVIVRRYAITNMFDATLAALGIILGSYLYGNINPVVIVGASMGAALGLGVSGVVSTYIAERAERIAEIKKLEKALLANLKNSEIARAHQYAAAVIAFVSGASSAFAVAFSTTPFILTILGLVDGEAAFICSVLLSLTLLYALGFYLGRVSRQNSILYGLVTLGAGVLVATVLFLVGAL